MSYVQKYTPSIIGAGPAGLTAAHELFTRTENQPIVQEMSGYMGGISWTVPQQMYRPLEIAPLLLCRNVRPPVC